MPGLDAFIGYLRANLHSRCAQRGKYPYTYDFLLVTPEIREKYKELLATNFKGSVEDADKLAKGLNDETIIIKDGDNLPKEIDVTKLRVVKVNQDSITIKYIE